MNGGARIVNIVLGAWLFISAFLWSHSQAQFVNTWIVGLAIAVVALLGLATGPARYLNTAIAIWLFISVWILPGANTGTRWNNAIVAILVFLFSLAPAEKGRPIMPPGQRVRA